MSALILDQSLVKKLLPMARCITLTRKELSALARGNSVNPMRSYFVRRASNAGCR